MLPSLVLKRVKKHFPTYKDGMIICPNGVRAACRKVNLFVSLFLLVLATTLVGLHLGGIL